MMMMMMMIRWLTVESKRVQCYPGQEAQASWRCSRPQAGQDSFGGERQDWGQEHFPWCEGRSLKYVERE